MYKDVYVIYTLSVILVPHSTMRIWFLSFAHVVKKKSIYIQFHVNVTHFWSFLWCQLIWWIKRSECMSSYEKTKNCIRKKISTYWFNINDVCKNLFFLKNLNECICAHKYNQYCTKKNSSKIPGILWFAYITLIGVIKSK